MSFTTKEEKDKNQIIYILRIRKILSCRHNPRM